MPGFPLPGEPVFTSRHFSPRKTVKPFAAGRTGVCTSAHLAPHETEIIACRANRGHHFPVNGCRLVASPKMVREPGFFASAHLLPHETEKSRAARTGVFASVHLAPRQRKKSRVPGAVMMLMYMYAHVYWLGRAIILTNEVGILF